jgi:hypothetical protein
MRPALPHWLRLSAAVKEIAIAGIRRRNPALDECAVSA